MTYEDQVLLEGFMRICCIIILFFLLLTVPYVLYIRHQVSEPVQREAPIHRKIFNSDCRGEINQ